ncbi:lactose 3-dehydrogenase subunit gamma LacC [soil metagenome]
MERREALRNLALSIWGLMLLPGCDIGRSKLTPQEMSPLSLTPLQDEALTEAVDTLLPATDTPGAVDLHVHDFVQKIMADCYEKEEQDEFVKGLSLLQDKAKESFGTSFGASSKEQRIDLMTSFEQSEEELPQNFFARLKELTILGYSTSEYVMTNLTNYNMVPGHFHGCVPVSSKKSS